MINGRLKMSPPKALRDANKNRAMAMLKQGINARRIDFLLVSLEEPNEYDKRR